MRPLPFDLRGAREARGLSQQALADLSGVSRAQIQRIEKTPSIGVRGNTQALLAQALGTELASTHQASSEAMPFYGLERDDESAAWKPTVHDIRAGLTQEVLDGLHRADRVALAAKDARTGILGYWIGPHLSVALITADPLFTLMQRAPREMTEQLTRVAVRWSTPRFTGVVFVARNAHDDPRWSRILGVLRVGDLLRLSPDRSGAGRAVLNIHAGNMQLVTFALHRRRRDQRARSAA
jgi:transcriptional regulator with XRE-family HTH domain